MDCKFRLSTAKGIPSAGFSAELVGIGRLVEQVAANAGKRNRENGGAGRSGSLAVAGCGCCRHGASSGEKSGRQSYGIILAQTQCGFPLARGVTPGVGTRPS
jgi:hypothetical protein